MKQKTIAFRFERCLGNNAHAQTLCKSFLTHGYNIYIITSLPEHEFHNQICDFALDNGIYYRNILFRECSVTRTLAEQLKLKLYFSANEFEVRSLNEGIPRPLACHLPYKR